MKVLAIQHEEGTGPLRFGDWLADSGAVVDVVRPDLGDRLPPISQFKVTADALIVLGGSADADDDVHNPWFVQTKKLLVASSRGAFPSFNICLGGQMLALATGGGIRRREIPQYGVFGLSKVTEAQGGSSADPVFGGIRDGSKAILFHSDEIVLPQSAVQLLTGSDSPVQAFRVGDCAWGTQFHPETTANQVADWFSRKSDWGVDTSALVASVREAEATVEETFAPVAEAFVRYCHSFAAVRQKSV